MSVTGGLYIKHILTDRAALVLQVESVTEKLQFEKDQNKLSEERVITLERSRDKAEENVVYLRELYNGHDLNKLIAAKPKWMTKKMLKATEEKLNELQIITSE